MSALGTRNRVICPFLSMLFDGQITQPIMPKRDVECPYAMSGHSYMPSFFSTFWQSEHRHRRTTLEINPIKPAFPSSSPFSKSFSIVPIWLVTCAKQAIGFPLAWAKAYKAAVSISTASKFSERAKAIASFVSLSWIWIRHRPIHWTIKLGKGSKNCKVN